MIEHSDLVRLRKEHEQLMLRFVATDLDVAIRFCQTALSTEDSAKAVRNAKNARKAYEAATLFLRDKDLKSVEYDEVAGKALMVEQMLAKCPGG